MDRKKLAAGGLSVALAMFLLERVVTLSERVAALEVRAQFFHGTPTPDEKAEAK